MAEEGVHFQSPRLIWKSGAISQSQSHPQRRARKVQADGVGEDTTARGSSKCFI